MFDPFKLQRLAREKAAMRYLAALEKGDFAAIDAVWQEAASDPTLEQLLFQLHEAFPTGQELLAGFREEDTPMHKSSPPRNEPGHDVGSTTSSPFNRQSTVRSQRTGQRRWALPVYTLVALLLVALVAGGFLFLRTWNSTPLTRPTPTPSITPTPMQSPLAKLTPLCRVALPTAYQTHTDLNDILVLSNSDIWLVGANQAGALALHWNGTQWDSIPTQAPDGSTLLKLAALGSNNIWAIGETVDGGNTGPGGGGGAPPSHTLIEHWNGTTWSQTQSPDLLASTRNLLQDITIAGPNDVWVAGMAGSQVGGKSIFSLRASPLLEHWNGTNWQLVQLPGIQLASLKTIVALSANDVWLAGGIDPASDGAGGNVQNTPNLLLLHWNGQSWNRVSTASSVPAQAGILVKLAADSSHHLWALGFDENAMPLLLSMSNTGKWSTMSVPPVPASSGGNTHYNQFLDLYAVDPQNLWLAGTSNEVPPSGVTTITPLVEHWDGHHWQAAAIHYSGQAYLQTIVVNDSAIWASGHIDFNQPFLLSICR